MTKKRQDAMVALVTATLLVWVAASSGTAAPDDPWTRKELGENAQPDPTAHSAAAFDAEREKVVLFIPEMEGTEGVEHKSETWVWDGAGWEKVAPLVGAAPKPSSYNPAMAYDAARKEIVLFIAPKPADPDPNSDVPGETYTWNGQTWSKKSPDDSPPAHERAAMAFDEVQQQIVLLTGVAVDPTAPVNGTWLWDGTNWEKADDPKGPSPARIDAAMAFDRRLGKVVLFGGSETRGDDSNEQHTVGMTKNSLCDTWAWDGKEWTEIKTDPAPPPRTWHAMVADTGSNVSAPEEPSPFEGLVLFGGLHLGGTPNTQGRNGAFYLNDTWVWKGKSWKRQPSAGPSPRFGHGMAYDPGEQETVLFGGRIGIGTGDGPPNNETWTLESGPETNDDHSQPEISIDEHASVWEGVEGETNTISFGVSATGLECTPKPVTVPYSTQDHTAEHPDDYEQTTGTVTFTNGQSAAIVKVKVNGDNVREEDEQFYVELGTPNGATIREGMGTATGTIIDSSEDPVADPGLVELPEVETPAIEAPDTPHLPRLPEVSPPSGGGGSEGSGPSPSNSGTLGPGGRGPGVGSGDAPPTPGALSSSANPPGSASLGAIPVTSPPQPSPHVSSTQSAQAAGILLSQPPPFALAPQQVPWTAGAQGQMSAALGSASSEPDDPQPQPAFEMTAISPDQPQGSVFFWLGLLALLTVMIARPARRSVWHCGSDGASTEQYDPKPSPAWAGAR